MPLNHQENVIKWLSVTCPLDWTGHQGHCYRFSGEEKNWNESQNFCMSLNASLAKITKEEMVSNVTVDTHHRSIGASLIVHILLHEKAKRFSPNITKKISLDAF